MTFEKALEAMKNGKRVTRKGWENGEIYHIQIIAYRIMCEMRYGSFIKTVEYRINNSDVMADDWEIVREKKEKDNLPVFDLDYGKTTENECIVRTSNGEEHKATYALKDIHFFGENCKQYVVHINVLK